VKKKVIHSVHAIHSIVMKAKGNDRRLLVQSKWRKTDKKRKQAWRRHGSQGVVLS
jgi:hypothetical protein